MEANKNKRINTIDGFRGIALLMVLLYHAYGFSGAEPKFFGLPVLAPLAFGYSGVDLFFVISGFCLYYAWAFDRNRAARNGWGTYYWRRFLRIYPPYIASLLLFLLPGLLFGESSAWADLLWHLPFLQTFSNDYFYGANGPLWSLAVEAHFYILFPLFVLAAGRWGIRRTVLVILGASLLYRTGVYLLFPELSYRQVPKVYLQGFLLARVPNFVLGMLIANLWTDGSLKLYGLGRATTTAGARQILLAGAGLMAATWVSIYFVRNASMIWRDLGFAVAYALLVFGSLHAGWWQHWITIKPLLWLGNISFSIYLIHAPLMIALNSWFKAMLGLPASAERAIVAISFGVSLPLVIIFGWVFYYLVERPCITLARRALQAPVIAGDVATQ